MTQVQFAPATKAQAKLRAALFGPSGSGKTMSALRIAEASRIIDALARNNWQRPEAAEPVEVY